MCGHPVRCERKDMSYAKTRDASVAVRAWLKDNNPLLLAPFTLMLPILLIAFAMLWYGRFEKPDYRYPRTCLRA
jgi:hypothetical protein